MPSVAIKYGISKTFEEPQLVLFFDMGASSVEVSLVNFSEGLNKKNKSVGKSVVLFGSSVSLGIFV